MTYSQRYLFNAIPDTNHNANPTNPNRYIKGNPNPGPTKSRPEPPGAVRTLSWRRPGQSRFESFKDRPDTISSPILVSLPLDGCWS